MPGRRFRDLDHLNQELEKWLLEVADIRIHGTTHERPLERFKAETLIALKHVKPYVYSPHIQRKISQDSLVSFASNRYSVPWIYVGQCVDLKVVAGKLFITHQETTIATHLIAPGKHQHITNQVHYGGLCAPKHRYKKAPMPQHDPYWTEDSCVSVRDLAVYEVAFASSNI